MSAAIPPLSGMSEEFKTKYKLCHTSTDKRIVHEKVLIMLI